MAIFDKLILNLGTGFESWRKWRNDVHRRNREAQVIHYETLAKDLKQAGLKKSYRTAKNKADAIKKTLVSSKDENS